MPIDNLLCYARIGVFQSTKFKSFNKVYTDRLVKLGNQELSAVYILICALLLMYASVIFTFTFKHSMINKLRNCYSNCYLFVVVMLNQIQDLKGSIRFPSVTEI